MVKRGRRKKQIIIVEGQKGKICSRCNRWNPISEFKNPSWCTDCMKQYRKEYQKQYQQKNYFALKALGATMRAQKKGLESLETNDLEKLIKHFYAVQKGKCFYTGIQMEIPQQEHDNNDYSVSIDRLDNTKGYTPDNIVLCCNIVNRMKNALSYEKFIELCDKIAEEHKRSKNPAFTVK
ncbi:hypothetical protein P9851_03575 [Geobacillus stearothermophilus]|uniref:hypothetical protein n=1 Tax=Geobacillus stearothermophilus TaxID=1422 RepID=UPI002E223C6D|nr:hypothetical protein [Geobacillus stearothermophilus]